jgi:uncharacterized protein (TIGR03000 family)
MYSVVLMMAMTSGAEVPDFGRRGGCYGCWGGCYGGCYGCWGGCYGGCWGCYGGCYGCYGGCYGCYGGGWGTPVMYSMTVQSMPSASYARATTASAPATLVVGLPADAKLTIDDVPTTSTSSSRQFVSPDLLPGKEYEYTLKGEIVRDGKKIVAIKQVTVRAGEQTSAVLEFPVARLSRK